MWQVWIWPEQGMSQEWQRYGVPFANREDAERCIADERKLDRRSPIGKYRYKIEEEEGK